MGIPWKYHGLLVEVGPPERPSSSTPNNFPQALQYRRPGMVPQGASDGKRQKSRSKNSKNMRCSSISESGKTKKEVDRSTTCMQLSVSIAIPRCKQEC